MAAPTWNAAPAAAFVTVHVPPPDIVSDVTTFVPEFAPIDTLPLMPSVRPLPTATTLAFELFVCTVRPPKVPLAAVRSTLPVVVLPAELPITRLPARLWSLPNASVPPPATVLPE